MTVVRRALVSVLVAVALGLAVAAATAWHDGYRIYAVRTGSMTPTYPTGALVVDAPASDGAPGVGDVITLVSAPSRAPRRCQVGIAWPLARYLDSLKVRCSIKWAYPSSDSRS